MFRWFLKIFKKNNGRESKLKWEGNGIKENQNKTIKQQNQNETDSCDLFTGCKETEWNVYVFHNALYKGIPKILIWFRLSILK